MRVHPTRALDSVQAYRYVPQVWQRGVPTEIMHLVKRPPSHRMARFVNCGAIQQLGPNFWIGTSPSFLELIFHPTVPGLPTAIPTDWHRISMERYRIVQTQF
jgi:hypothetical protein